MQDLQSIARGRMFGAAVERRLRPLSHHHHQQSLKCPRCDSTNTKFCYYNNYNLSQPRHFCKGCRRYWTKGGVLRNVPVGGGCRKNKRSKAKQSLPEKPNATAASCEVQTAANSPPQNTPEQKSSSHSGSESSSLTAATTAVAMTTESVSEAAGVASFSTEGGLLNIREYESLVVPTDVPNPDGACRRVLLGHGSENGAFPDIGNFTGLVTASTEPITCGFGFGSMLLSQPSLDTCQQNQWQSQDRSQTLGDLFDRTAQVDLAGMGSVSCDGEFVPLDWQVKDHGAFDLHTTVDQAYWSQGQSQWTYRDQGQNPEPLPSINFSQFHF